MAQEELAGNGAAEEGEETGSEAVGAHVGNGDDLTGLEVRDGRVAGKEIGRGAEGTGDRRGLAFAVGGAGRVVGIIRALDMGGVRHDAAEPGEAAEVVNTTVEDDVAAAVAVFDVGDGADKSSAARDEMPAGFERDLGQLIAPPGKMLVEF